MKKISTLFCAALMLTSSLALTSFTSERKSVKQISAYYDVQLNSTQQVNNNFEWIWSVANPNPGNGNDGTMQNLSHWSLAIDDLVNVEDIVSVAYSLDGTNWTNLSVSFAVDKSQTCYRGTVLKFDHGTVGSAPTYYKLVVNKDFSTGYAVTNFKSGSKTGCYNGSVLGIGTPEEGGSIGR